MKRCAERAEHVCKFYPRLCHKCLAFREETNGDRIRAMTDEELADFITNCGCYDHARDCRASCKDCTMEWLKQHVED